MTAENNKVLKRENIRNIAIIAHVDHGKTTLVDRMLEQSGSLKRNEAGIDRAMDSNSLERERGITILSKCTSMDVGDLHLNVVDTPGHTDFGGEVERVMRMVDSVLLLVDAFDGPMPQTRFVLQKALARGLRPIVVINKIDREGCDPDGSLTEVFDLFVSLDANDEQLDFPVVYASAKQGFALHNLEDEPKDLGPLFEVIRDKVKPPAVDDDGSPALQVATFTHDDFLGFMATGRVVSGSFKQNDMVLQVRRDGTREEFRINRILGFRGLNRFDMVEAVAGDIVTLTGMKELNVGETITSIENPRILPLLEIDAPTVSMAFRANTSPFSGEEGSHVTSQNLKERLEREIRSNVSLRVAPTDAADTFIVSGRGELHLSVLIETMRREGYEFMVSRPEVVLKEDENGRQMEPYESVVADLNSERAGIVIDALNRRGGRMTGMREMRGDRTRLDFIVPTRGLIGYRSQFMTDTRGMGILSHVFLEYGPHLGPMRGRASGAIIAQETCSCVTFGLWKLQDRGMFFVTAGDNIYAGQVIGERNRSDDIVVNAGKSKKLTNLRASAADEKNYLKPHRVLSIEDAIEFINDDEYVEFTPKSIRIRKRFLDHNDRKRNERGKV
jgi:GTP-binding protein